MTELILRQDDLTGPEIINLLETHLETMRAISPPESVHALDLEALRDPSVTFWSVWEEGSLVGCGALKIIAPGHGEIKSMHTARAQRGKGVAATLVDHIIATATEKGLTRLSLETGSTEHFKPARDLYARFGFQVCGPFADYTNDPHSAFMTLEL